MSISFLWKTSNQCNNVFFEFKDNSHTMYIKYLSTKNNKYYC